MRGINLPAIPDAYRAVVVNPQNIALAITVEITDVCNPKALSTALTIR
jgi:hypothetical protein